MPQIFDILIPTMSITIYPMPWATLKTKFVMSKPYLLPCLNIGKLKGRSLSHPPAHTPTSTPDKPCNCNCLTGFPSLFLGLCFSALGTLLSAPRAKTCPTCNQKRRSLGTKYHPNRWAGDPVGEIGQKITWYLFFVGHLLLSDLLVQYAKARARADIPRQEWCLRFIDGVFCDFFAPHQKQQHTSLK